MSKTCRKPSSKPTAALIALIALCSTSCRSSSATTTTRERTEAHAEATLSLTRTIDSILVRETVLIRERPDTVTVERERTVWRERTRHDTVRVTKTDTVVLTKEVVVETHALAGTPLKGERTTHTPGWAWLSLLTLAGLLAAQIIRVKHKLNNR